MSSPTSAPDRAAAARPAARTTAEADAPAALLHCRARVDAALAALCDRHLPPSQQSRTAAAIRYSLLGDGKRLRPVIVLASYEAAGGAGDATALAAAVEVVHAYSLVHDDLPCMDDDDVRRGRPTVHRVYGSDAATRAGVAMVPLAAVAALDAALALGLREEECGAIVRELMHASGSSGMIGGQMLDLESEGEPLALAQLERIHRAKTGTLITAAALIGGRAARASDAALAALARFGASVGLAFQIADDVLDVTATTDQLGKTAGRDVALHKSTYPALLGVANAQSRAAALIRDACDALASAGLLTPTLEHIAKFTVARRS